MTSSEQKASESRAVVEYLKHRGFPAAGSELSVPDANRPPDFVWSAGGRCLAIEVTEYEPIVPRVGAAGTRSVEQRWRGLKGALAAAAENEQAVSGLTVWLTFAQPFKLPDPKAFSRFSSALVRLVAERERSTDPIAIIDIGPRAKDDPLASLTEVRITVDGAPDWVWANRESAWCGISGAELQALIRKKAKGVAGPYAWLPWWLLIDAEQQGRHPQAVANLWGTCPEMLQGDASIMAAVRCGPFEEVGFLIKGAALYWQRTSDEWRLSDDKTTDGPIGPPAASC